MDALHSRYKVTDLDRVMSGRLKQAAKQFAASTVRAAQPLRWAVQVKTTTNRETTGLVEVGRVVGTGDAFWIHVRNSVYLAAGDLIWVIKDSSAQGNWIFDGFVEGAGTGESLDGSPIPSVATPVLTSPDGTPLIIRPVAGQQGTIGRAGETFNFAGAINVAQGITFASLGAGIVQSSAGGVLSSDYTIDATTTWASGTNILPADASGQDLGAAATRWDLYTQDVIFGGATGTNVITIPDNLADALHLSDAGGLEYIRIVSTDAQPIIRFNDAGADIDHVIEAVDQANAFNLRGSDGFIGLHTAPRNNEVVALRPTFTDPAAATYAMRIRTATTLTGNNAQSIYAMSFSAVTDNVAHNFGTLYGVQGVVSHFGSGALAEGRAMWAGARVSGAGDITVATGLFVHSGLGGGTGDIGTNYSILIKNPVGAGAGTITGTNYALYIENQTRGATNYAIYAAGARSYHAGTLAVGGTDATTAQLLVDQSAAGGAVPVAILDQGDVSEQHIVCTMGGADMDFPAIIQLAVTGTPAFWWDESADAFAFTNGLEVGDVVGGNFTHIEADGTIEFNGNATVWNDIYFPMSSGKIGGANQPTWAAFQGNTMEYSFAINDYIHLPTQEIAHSYKEGSNIVLHVHIVLDGSDVGDTKVNYEIEYTIGDLDEVMSAAAVETSGDYTITGGTADRTHLYIPVATIVGTNLKAQSALKMRFRRVALDGAGNPPGNDPFVLMVGAHIEEDTVGSRAETTK